MDKMNVFPWWAADVLDKPLRINWLNGDRTENPNLFMANRPMVKPEITIRLSMGQWAHILTWAMFMFWAWLIRLIRAHIV